MWTIGIAWTVGTEGQERHEETRVHGSPPSMYLSQGTPKSVLTVNTGHTWHVANTHVIHSIATCTVAHSWPPQSMLVIRWSGSITLGDCYCQGSTICQFMVNPCLFVCKYVGLVSCSLSFLSVHGLMWSVYVGCDRRHDRLGFRGGWGFGLGVDNRFNSVCLVKVEQSLGWLTPLSPRHHRLICASSAYVR